jgi:GNAT superfamily N-acetyltransferase
MKAPGYRVRPAVAPDLPLLAEVEAAANARFAPADLPPALRDELLPPAMLERGRVDGWLWVAAAVADDHAVGFALGCAADPTLALLLEIDVHPEHGRQGLGAALIAHVAAAARARGHARLGLITFEHLPWNAPMYERLGFVRRGGPDVPAVLRDALTVDAARGLHRRVAMTLELAPPRPETAP